MAMGKLSLRDWHLGVSLLLGFCVSPSLCSTRVAASVLGSSLEQHHARQHPRASFVLAPEVLGSAARPPDDAVEEQYGDLCHDGPKQTDFWSGPRPKEFFYWTLLTLIGFVATAMVAIPCLARLMHVDMSDKPQVLRARAFQTILLASAPLIVALCKVIVLAIPSKYAQVEAFMDIFEAYALFQFHLLLFGYVGEREIDILFAFGWITPLKVWAVPPLCCCWAPFYACMERRTPSTFDIYLVRLFVFQLIVFIPLLAVFDVVVLMTENQHANVARLELCSLLLAMYGIFALISWTHKILETRQTHLKFWGLKGVIIGSTLAYRLSKAFAARDIQILGSCYPAEIMIAVRAGAITALVCVPFAFMNSRSLTPDELA